MDHISNTDRRVRSNEENKMTCDIGPVPTFNRAELLDLVDGDEELANELVSMFIESTPGIIQELTRAIGNKDPHGVARHGHKIKGSSLSVGANALYKVALSVELAGKNGALDNASQLAEKLEKEFELFKETLAQYLSIETF